MTHKMNISIIKELVKDANDCYADGRITILYDNKSIEIHFNDRRISGTFIKDFAAAASAFSWIFGIYPDDENGNLYIRIN